ncbi:sulfite exporter TauE/SafE family protein [Ponticaulis sp.]|uniref:sulfite exporter TauE/SafE family protein n=1 Tax=Ponticaulis sp. TaxID=2020902 RepID=UPI000B6CE96E|nr:sulfite exporter TauE/SafE family protein [Ponticaulis sp.]MAI88969.1 hypothetical protein [Ponticaulis sp.]OUY01655.1 MAG: hypothetical protein CBB65_00625 [Hyphomonadaceae bacterium TMED5]|tara:strand:- start:88695 stop:89519 length:825 start_codon:yes stop_codon:yes gene_type:complete
MTEFIAAYGPLLLALIAAGTFAGLIAGLFGIGGGVVIVPVLAFVFDQLGFTETSMHAAVGCSLATIVATSIRSAMAHHKRGAVDMEVVKGWVPWIMAGSVLGALIAGFLPGPGMRAIFGIILLLVALQFIMGRPSWKLRDSLPTGLPRVGLAGGLGALSGIMGIGGGVFGVTLMTLCGYTVHRAVGTAATFGAAIGFPAAIGYAVTGWGLDGRAPFSLGYLNVPAILIIGIMTTSLAPVGAALAHRLDATTLRRVFGVVMILVSGNMVRIAFGF